MEGNQMKTREILERIDMRLVSINCIDSVQKQSIDRCRMLIKQALSAPPRNCDVGTAEEQKERFEEFCDYEKGDLLNCLNCRLCNALDYELAWAQMPYEAEEGGAE